MSDYYNGFDAGFKACTIALKLALDLRINAIENSINSMEDGLPEIVTNQLKNRISDFEDLKVLLEDSYQAIKKGAA